MNFNYTAEELVFRDEVRAFLRDKLPRDIAHKVLKHKQLDKDDYVRWQKILHEQNWIAPGWPALTSCVLPRSTSLM